MPTHSHCRRGRRPGQEVSLDRRTAADCSLRKQAVQHCPWSFRSQTAGQPPVNVGQLPRHVLLLQGRHWAGGSPFGVPDVQVAQHGVGDALPLAGTEANLQAHHPAIPSGCASAPLRLPPPPPPPPTTIAARSQQHLRGRQLLTHRDSTERATVVRHAGRLADDAAFAVDAPRPGRATPLQLGTRHTQAGPRAKHLVIDA